MKKYCVFCNKEFESPKPKTKFCSDKCRVYHSRAEKKEVGFIYALKHPITGEVFYIGKTTVALKHRLWGHISDGMSGKGEKGQAIKEILDSNKYVDIELLELVEGETKIEINKKMADREQQWIIDLSKKTTLTNKKMNESVVGIRFDSDQLELVKEREGLTSPQAVVYFLLEDYQKRMEDDDALFDERVEEPQRTIKKKTKKSTVSNFKDGSITVPVGSKADKLLSNSPYNASRKNEPSSAQKPSAPTNYKEALEVIKSGVWNKEYESLPFYRKLSPAQVGLIQRKIKEVGNA